MDAPVSETKASACTRVFNVLELAEHILLDMSLQDLLCSAQRVSKQWHSAITHSLALQQALFLRPVGRKPVVYTTHSAPHPLCPGTGTLTQDHWAEPDTPSKRCVVLENPLVSRLLRSHVNAQINKLHQQPVPLPVVGTLNLDAAQYEHASWRRMLATQPPMAEALMTRKFDHGTALKSHVHMRTGGMGVLLHDLDLPVVDEKKMAALSIAGWYLWETCELSDRARDVRRRTMRRK